MVFLGISFLTNNYVILYVCEFSCKCGAEFLICFEAWAKFVQQWLVHMPPLGIHLEPINKALMLLVTI